MKKVILSLAILVATSISAFAATDNKTETGAPACKTQTACSTKGACGDKKEKGNRADKAFEGLGLTSEQQTKLAELRKSCASGKENKEAKDSAKSNLTDEQKKQLKAERRAKHLEARKKYLENVKAILTPEQYDKFLENSYLSKANKKSDGKGNGKKMQRKGKDGKSGDNKMARRGDRQNKNMNRA